ncbi:MAG: T9SS type A sorting domain-containing protein [Bacteroidales bacterium]|nr:T9SS type A sorting domain-containing protein [Bacteroidales bacterium]
MKTISRALSLLIFILFIVKTHAQVVSKPEGGIWSSSGTWIGNVIPTSNDSVIIQGDVSINGSVECKQLVILSGASLSNAVGSCGEVKVTKNFQNYGKVFTQSPNYYCYGSTLNIRCLGNISRVGDFRPQKLIIAQSGEHHFYNPGQDTINCTVVFSDSAQLICHDNLILKGAMVNGILDMLNNDIILTKGANIQHDFATFPYISLIKNVKRIYSSLNSFIGNNESSKVIVMSNDTIHLYGSFATSGITFNGVVINHDSIFNREGSCGTIVFNDKFKNLGVVTTKASNYYCYGTKLNISLGADLLSIGKLSPTAVYLTGNKAHRFYNTSDTIFCPIFNNDTSWIECHGSLITKSEIRNTNINLQSNDFVLVGNASWTYNIYDKAFKLSNVKKIYSSKGSVCGNNEKSIIEGDSILLYGYFSSDGITFKGNVVNYDTMANIGEKWKVFYGSFTNKGTIINNTGWHVSHTLQFFGDVSNFGTWQSSNIFLSGKGKRTIKLNSAVADIIYFTDSIVLTGLNNTTHLKPYNYSSICYIDSGATLVISDGNLSSQIISYGHIQSSTSNIISYADLNMPYASLRIKSGSTVENIIFDSYSNQYFNTNTRGIKHWWAIRNTPRNYEERLNYATFYYTQAEASKINESKARLYVSQDGGNSWNLCNYSIDTLNNFVKAWNIPLAGYYVITTVALDSIFENTLAINDFYPRTIGYNSNFSLIEVTGRGFNNSCKVFFKNNNTIVNPDTVILSDPSFNKIKIFVRFPQPSSDKLLYTLIITRGNDSVIAEKPLTVEKNASSNVWIVLGGRDRTLSNRWQTFEFSYGNSGNKDAWGVPLFIAIKEQENMEVDFPDVQITMPSVAYKNGNEYFDSTSLYFKVDSISDEPGPWRIYGFYLPHIAAGATINKKIKVKAPGDIEFQTWVIKPYEPPVLPSTLGVGAFRKKNSTALNACLTAFAMKSFAQSMAGFVPGVGCVSSLADQYFQPVEYMTGTNTVEDNSWGSLLRTAAGWATAIANCASDVIPVGTAVKIGVGIASMMSDIAQNYDADQKCREVHIRRRFKTRTVASLDPNEKVGNLGSSDNHYINAQQMAYTIYFENKDSATANAIEVFISDTLDSNVFDYKKLRFSSFSFGDTTIFFKTDTNFVYQLIDLYPKKDIKVEFTASVDNKGIVKWKIASLDRLTNELIDDPDRGFLPPNINSPEGEGNVTFSVPLKESLSSGTVIKNKAVIVFDQNKPIFTNTYSNILDTEPPVSSISAYYDSTSSSIIIQAQGYDLVSGIFNYSLKVSEGIGSPYPFFTLYNSNTTSFKVHRSGTYNFYCTATDNAGNIELNADLPKTSIYVPKSTLVANLHSKECIYPNPVSDYLIIDLPINYKYSYLIQNLQGETILMGSLSYSKQKVNVKNLSTGIYFIRIININETKTFIFLKE